MIMRITARLGSDSNPRQRSSHTSWRSCTAASRISRRSAGYEGEAMTDQEFSLKGEVALVTGSGRGLGHAIALRLAQLGADVAIHDQQTSAPAQFRKFPDLDPALSARPRQ